MKQETGNRTFDQQDRELSIQITLNGFSFAISERGAIIFESTATSCDFAAADQYQNVTIGWMNDAVVLIPTSEFVADNAAAYLLAANLLGPNDVALSSSYINPSIMAVWSVDRTMVEYIIGAFPRAAHYHNLELDIASTSNHALHCESSVKPSGIARIAVVENQANVVVYTPQGLYAAETIAFATPHDLLYFVMRLATSDLTLELVAADTTPFQHIFGNQYPHCRFIDTPNMYHSKILKCE